MIDPPDLGSPPGLKYGFLPADVIDGLNDKDAWKVRATAVENFFVNRSKIVKRGS